MIAQLEGEEAQEGLEIPDANDKTGKAEYAHENRSDLHFSIQPLLSSLEPIGICVHPLFVLPLIRLDI